MSVVALGGSRVLSVSGSRLAAGVARSLLASGASLSVGCASGADAAFLLSAVSAGCAARVSVFAVGGPSGAGWPLWSRSGPSGVPVAVSAAVSSGASPFWWAGGGAGVPLRARLAVRSRACVSSASSAVFVVSSPSSRGSFGAARFAVRLGLPVFVVPVGFCPSLLPALAPGGAWSWCGCPFGAAVPVFAWVAG